MEVPRCSSACTHCLASSGPNGIAGMLTENTVATIDTAAALGVERVYITGGEPFLRRDICDLARHITETHGCELIVLTNATLFAGRVRELLRTPDRGKVKFQVSIDGARPATNDPIRGAGRIPRHSYTRRNDHADHIGERICRESGHLGSDRPGVEIRPASIHHACLPPARLSEWVSPTAAAPCDGRPSARCSSPGSSRCRFRRCSRPRRSHF